MLKASNPDILVKKEVPAASMPSVPLISHPASEPEVASNAETVKEEPQSQQPDAAQTSASPQRSNSATSEPVHPNAKTTTTKQSNGSVTTRQNMSTPVCKNCKTQNTPLWRRDESGQVLCNACGLFLKLHGRPRPIYLKSDVIKSRNRVKHNNSKSNPNTPELKAKGTKFSAKAYRPKTRAKKKPKMSASVMQAAPQPVPQPVPQVQVQQVPQVQVQPLQAPPASQPQPGPSPGLLPLLPRGQNGQSYGFTGILSTAAGSPASWSKVSTTIHPLHYPSSTPTRFAPNLTRVTSPLLLSSTAPPKFNASQSSERSSSQSQPQPQTAQPQTAGQPQSLSRDAMLNAAGALETLSRQSSNDKIPGMRLDNSAPTDLPTPAGSTASAAAANSSSAAYARKPFSPSTELNGYATPPLGPTASVKLPSLDAATAGQRPQAMSPAFGASLYQSQFAPQPQSSEKLPPIKTLTQQSSPLGATSVFSPRQQPQQSPPQPGVSQQRPPQLVSPLLVAAGDSTVHSLPSLARSPMLTALQQQHIQQQQRQQQQSPVMAPVQRPLDGAESNEELRTRISELELVNDLYKTRIVELEAMDNASKQREMLLKKRIDELTDALRRGREYHYTTEYLSQPPSAQQTPLQRPALGGQGSPQQLPQLASPQIQPGGDLKRAKIEQ